MIHPHATLPPKSVQRSWYYQKAIFRTSLQRPRGRNVEPPVTPALWLGLRMPEIRGLTWDYLKTNGIKHYCFHSLRHVNTSGMLPPNVPDNYAMKRMEPSTNNMLKTVYQHTLTEKGIEVGPAVDGYSEPLIKPEQSGFSCTISRVI